VKISFSLQGAYSHNNKKPISIESNYNCQICGSNKNITIFNIFSTSIFTKNNNILILCTDCAKNLQKIITHSENQILKNHKKLYCYLNCYYLDNNYNKRKKIKLEIKKEIMICINPQKIIHKKQENKRNRTKKIKCGKCGNFKKLSTHHLYKRHVFGENGYTVILCKSCHNEIEQVISYAEKKILEHFEGMYLEICNLFINKKIHFKDKTNHWLKIYEEEGVYKYIFKKQTEH